MTKNTVTYVHNKAMEDIERDKLNLDWSKLDETIRHNQSEESIKSVANDLKRLADVELDARERAKLAETIRNNIATLNETYNWHMTQKEMADLDRQIDALKVAENQRSNDIAEKQLENNLQAAVLRGSLGSLFNNLPKIGLTGAALVGAKGFLTKAEKILIGNPANPTPLLKQLAESYAREHNLNPGILNGLLSKLPFIVKTGLKAAAVPAALAGTALTLTRSSDPEISRWKEEQRKTNLRSRRSKRDEENEIPDEIQINGKSMKWDSIKSPKLMKGDYNNETSSKSKKNDEMAGNRTTFNSEGPGSNNFKSDANRESSNVIYSKGTERRKESGPGIGVAFS